jgi:ankyrin repeat protein
MLNKRFAFLITSLFLCASGFCQNQKDPADLIILAVKEGNLQKVLAFLDGGIDINRRGAFGYTPLIAAAKYSQLEIAKVLCARGADLNMATDVAELYGEWGSTALLWAARNCHLKMARLLMDKGAEVGRPGGEGDTPLMVSARENCQTLVRWLVAKGAAVEAVREYDGATALIEAVSAGSIDVADYLIKNGANLKARDRLGRSMLSLSAASANFLEVRYFLEKGLPVNDQDKNGGSAIFYAIGSSLESQYILEYLLSHGADPRLKNKQGVSPLMRASYLGQTNEAKMLVDNGALVDESSHIGETPLHFACRGIPPKIEDGFEAGAAAEATIRFLVEKGAPVNAKDNEGKTPLMNAALGEAPGVFGYLLDKGAQANIQDRNGWTALMYAADWNQLSVITVLARRGADLNLRNSRGNTALGIAKLKESSAQASELLKRLGAIE